MAAIGIRARARADSQLRETAVLYMLLAAALFYASYGLANWAASQRAFVPTVIFDWERRIPFLAWTIMPYWSLNIFYAASFFICCTRDELNRHMGRLVAAQVISVSLFLIFPLSFGLARPETRGIAGAMFGALDSFDQPFNQAPSLHLGLAVIVAARLRTHLHGFARRILEGWFVLVGASALTTYQHHFIDIPTGLAVGALCCAFLPDGPLGIATQSRQITLSAIYCIGALLLAGLGLSLGGWGLWLLWPASSCLIVGAIYWQGRPALFQKRDGTIPVTLRWLLAPYLAAARVNSWCWTRGERAANEIIAGVWLGRSSYRDPRIVSIVDLAAELPTRLAGIRYALVPMLDLAVPSVEQIDAAVVAIERFRKCGPTLVCCALGYSRSALAVAAWLTATGRASSVNDAIAIIDKRRRISLGLAHRTRLQEWAGERIVPPRTRIARIVSSALVLTARLVVGAEPRWAGCKPVVGQRIYVANHTSHADFVVLWASLPPKLRERTHPVAAADYWTRGPVRRFLAGRVFDAVLIDRQHVARSHNVLEIMRQALVEGKSLIVFPEGTRGTGSDLNDFKCGIYHVARCSPDVEIVPVWISNMHRVLPRGAFVPAPLLSSVTFGRPLVLAEREAKQDFLVRLRRAVIETGETRKCG